MDLGEVDLLRLRGLGHHLVVALQTCAAFRLTRLRGRAHPLEFFGKALRQPLVALLLRRQACGLRLEVGGVVALVGVQMPAVDLADPLGHVVQEVAVVRDGEHRSLVLVEELLEPQDRLGVQVVRRFVQKQQVRRLKQQAAERHAPAFAAGEHVHRHIGVGALQRVHRLRELAVQIPAVDCVDSILQLAHFRHERVEVGVGLGHEPADLVEAIDLRLHVAKRELDILKHRLVLIERRLLLEDSHGVAGREARLAVGDLLHARHQLQKRGLAHAVRTDHADFRAGIERQRDVVQDHLVAVRLARLVHLVNEFGHSIDSLLSWSLHT